METKLLTSARVAIIEPVLAEGVVSELTLNDSGRLRVASKQGYFPASTSNLTVLNTALTVDVSDSSNLVLHVKNTGTVAMAAGVFAFEGSVDSTNGVDGTWFIVQAVRSNANIIETGRAASSLAPASGEAYAWELSVNALRWFRIRCSTAVTASSIATWTVIRGSYATEPIPAVQTHPVSVSGNILVAPAAGTPYALTSTASTNAVSVKVSSGNLTEITVFNPTIAIVYVRLYNKASAPILGTDVPVTVIPVPVNGFIPVDFGLTGKRFLLGIGIAITGGPANTDATAIAAGVLVHATHM